MKCGRIIMGDGEAAKGHGNMEDQYSTDVLFWGVTGWVCKGIDKGRGTWSFWAGWNWAVVRGVIFHAGAAAPLHPRWGMSEAKGFALENGEKNPQTPEWSGWLWEGVEGGEFYPRRTTFHDDMIGRNRRG